MDERGAGATGFDAVSTRPGRLLTLASLPEGRKRPSGHHRFTRASILAMRCAPARFRLLGSLPVLIVLLVTPACRADDGTTDSSATSPADTVIERGEPAPPPAGEFTDLEITDDTLGSGPAVTATDVVTMHFVAFDPTGTEVGSSWETETPARLALASAIPGLAQGLAGMQPGGRRTIRIPAELGYGENPPAGSPIEANSALVYVIDLIGTEPASNAEPSAPTE